MFVKKTRAKILYAAIMKDRKRKVVQRKLSLPAFKRRDSGTRNMIGALKALPNRMEPKSPNLSYTTEHTKY